MNSSQRKNELKEEELIAVKKKANEELIAAKKKANDELIAEKKKNKHNNWKKKKTKSQIENGESDPNWMVRITTSNSLNMKVARKSTITAVISIITFISVLLKGLSFAVVVVVTTVEIISPLLFVLFDVLNSTIAQTSTTVELANKLICAQFNVLNTILTIHCINNSIISLVNVIFKALDMTLTITTTTYKAVFPSDPSSSKHSKVSQDKIEIEKETGRCDGRIKSTNEACHFKAKEGNKCGHHSKSAIKA
ncbi:hypothetical protein HK099_005534 [Clydaea vesicula]|uniref:Uncharacterized protein n=1 Tax=Clydaea vesicula TaxID=447962 RepID=A0AAD5U069_9FUNG|nr:hypothetical protein HK099_005534 [Clydaea vesicula]